MSRQPGQGGSSATTTVIPLSISTAAAIAVLHHTLLGIEGPSEDSASLESIDFAELAIAATRLAQFTTALANGDMRAELDVAGPLAGSLKALQADMRHLTWQARQIAEGDLTQHVQFLGEFSDAFNTMTGRLKATLDALQDRESELRLASLGAQHSALAMTMFDSSGRYLQVNQQATDLTGYSTDELLGMHVWDISPEFSPERLSQLWNEYYEIGELHVEALVHHQEGNLVPVEVAIARVPLEGEQVAVAFSTDITERKRGEDALRDSERKFAAAFAGSPVSMAIVDTHGLYLEVNRAWESHTGYTREELIGHDARVLGGWEPSTALATILVRFEKNGRVDKAEIRFRTKSGDPRIGLVTADEIVVAKESCVLVAIEDVTGHRRAEAETAESIQSLETLTRQTIETMARLVETRDPYTAGHELRVCKLSVAIARELGLDAQTLAGLQVAAKLHDVGKVSVPAEILAKPGRLNDAEFALVRGHAAAGYDILSSIDFPWPVAQIVRQHHERLDGSGYPQGLENGEILLEARILAVADVVEAMSAHRPYRPSLGIDVALDEILRGRGTSYDEDAVDACVRIFRERGFTLESD